MKTKRWGAAEMKGLRTSGMAFVASVFVVLGIATGAHATILTFDNLGLPNMGNIPTAYGDNVNALCDGVGCYGMGNGFTPNITVDYRTLAVGSIGTGGGTLWNHLDFWNFNYGDLVNVAYPVNPVSIGEISLVPEAGWLVRVNSFDLGGWWQTNYANQPVLILDEAYNVLMDFSPFLVLGAGPSHSTVSPNLTHNGILRIQFGNNWNVGIDNVNFDQVPVSVPVPEPASLLLLASGLVGLVALRRGLAKHSRRTG